MIGFAVRSPEAGYLTNRGGWSEKGADLFITGSLSRVKKVCKKYKKAVVVEITSFTVGRVVFRQK